MSKSPTLPLYAQSLGLTRGEIGIVAAASTITGIIVNVTSGFLSDIYGRKRLLVFSAFVFFSAPLLYFLADDALLLAAVRAYYGVATAVFVPVSFALVSDLYPDRKGAFMGLLSSATLVGRAIAPILAGSLIYFLGFSAVFVLCSLTGFLVMGLLMRLPTGEGRLERTRLSFSPGLLSIGLLEASSAMVYQGIETFLPLMYFFTGRPWLSGLILSLEIGVMALLKPYAGYLSDRIGRGTPILIGTSLVSLSAFLLALSGSEALAVAGALLFAVGASISGASTKPLASEVASMRGAALGFLESIKDIGQAIGPVLVGMLGIRTGFSAMGVISALSLGAFLIKFRKG